VICQPVWGARVIAARVVMVVPTVDVCVAA
jgi:hypothetical protein